MSDTSSSATALRSLSPLGWEHINLTGDYVWHANKRVAKGGFRPCGRPKTRFYICLRRSLRLNVLYCPLRALTAMTTASPRLMARRLFHRAIRQRKTFSDRSFLTAFNAGKVAIEWTTDNRAGVSTTRS